MNIGIIIICCTIFTLIIIGVMFTFNLNSKKEIKTLKEELNKSLTSELKELNAAQSEKIIDRNHEYQEKLVNVLDGKLDKMQGLISEKLDTSLNERLDENFKQVGEQLGSLYKSLGELQELSGGVASLNKTLSNVKSRGIFGELQLEKILETTMTPSQYDKNIITKKGSNDRVEFGIKIPDKEVANKFIYLPIDSKMPTDIYNRIATASEELDVAGLKTAVKELETRIKTEARTIRDKYIDPPNTTNFAIMFLPTEGLFAEALRIDGLSEWCQRECRVVIAGPTTITALLNSLQLGFSNMALNKKSQDVLKLLQAVKTQYGSLAELIDNTQKKLNEAMSATDKLKNRSEIINRKMGKITEIDFEESNNILAIEE